MGKIRQNFSLEMETYELLKTTDNMSKTVEKSVPFYLNNKDKKFENIKELSNLEVEL